jgi:hypothetical protein
LATGRGRKGTGGSGGGGGGGGGRADAGGVGRAGEGAAAAMAMGLPRSCMNSVERKRAHWSSRLRLQAGHVVGKLRSGCELTSE